MPGMSKKERKEPLPPPTQPNPTQPHHPTPAQKKGESIRTEDWIVIKGRKIERRMKDEEERGNWNGKRD